MFKPNLVLFENGAIDYEIGQALKERFEEEKIPIEMLKSNRIQVKGESQKDKYENAKRTLVVGVKKSLEFENCKPSAHYQLPLVTGCMGMCEYCYLNTRLGNSNYIRVYVNIEEILQKAKTYIEKRSPEITIFEGAATSDPIPVEGYTHNLEKVITFFGQQELGRFRFVTKYTDVDSLLSLNHNGHTEIRFSLNTNKIIKEYEHRTASMEKRIEALAKVANAGYQVGVLVAPVFLYQGWQEEYTDLLAQLQRKLQEKLTFEIITHRYTSTAKNRILEFYPDSTLPMKEEERKFKYGQFGYGKYVYQPEKMEEVKQFFTKQIEEKFKDSKILYII